MAIRKAQELDLSNVHVTMLIYGRPGVGKTQLALSASNPLLADIEDGVGRVEACYRSDTLQLDPSIKEEDKYEMLVNDLKESDLSCYNTLIIDSVGKLLDLFTPIVIRENASNAQKDGKTLSLKGYGAVKAKFNEFLKFIKGLGKDIIFIAHSTEQNDNDVIKNRILIPGSTKDSIWDDIDLGGFLEFQGKERVIHFKPTQTYDAKGTNGIEPTYSIPTLKSTKDGGMQSENTFLSQLIKKFKVDKLNAQKEYNEKISLYNEAMKILPEINAISSIDDLNAVLEKMKGITHSLTSKRELADHFKNKVEELGATYDKESGRYIKED